MTKAVYIQLAKYISAVTLLETKHYISAEGILINAKNKALAAAHFDSPDTRSEVCVRTKELISACTSARGYLLDGVWLVGTQCGKQQPLIPSLTFLCCALLTQKATLIKSARSAAAVAIRHLFVYTMCLRSHPSRQIVMWFWGTFSH